MLYMEGLRALQLHEAEADRADGGSKSEDVLRSTLDDAAKHFGECVGKYPKDLLPRYYHAIVLTLQGQAEQARQLRRDLEQSPVPTLKAPPEAESYYQRAAEQFERTATNARRELRMYASYNQAQALSNQAQAVAAAGRLGQARPLLDRANVILAGLALDARGVGRLERMSVATASSIRGGVSLSLQRLWIGPVGQSIPGLSRSIGDWPGGSLLIGLFKGVAGLGEWLQGAVEVAERADGGASLRAGLEPEGKALVFQVELLRTFIDLWTQAGERRLGVEMFPDSNAEGREPMVPKNLRTLTQEITMAELPARARQDLQAEYWNKWARLARALAQNPRDPGDRETLLRLAAHYYDTHLTELKRHKWTPAVLNYAFVLALQGEHGDARISLQLILGDPKPTQPPPSPTKPNVEAIKKYILDMPLGTPAPTVTRLLNSAYGPFEPATVQDLVRALDHTHLKMEFIERIIKGLARSSPRSSPPPPLSAST